MPASASYPNCKPSRLGVNPRRSHVPEPERKRVRTACNPCNTRRIKCSGVKPCDQCRSAQRTCEFPVFEKKVYVAENTYKELRESKDALEICLQNLLPDPVHRQNLLTEARQSLATRASSLTPIKDEETQGDSPAVPSSTVALSPPHFQSGQSPLRLLGSMDAVATEGSLLEDNDGTKRWLGGTSGATFLDHLKNFMQTLKSCLGYNGASPGSHFLASRGQYQTSDSRLLFTPTVGPKEAFSVSDRWTASYRLSKVDEVLQGCRGTSTWGGIHYFGDFSVQNWVAVQQDVSRARELAFYEVALALGTIYSLTATDSRRDGQLGETSFANARRILGDPTDISHYNMRDVATLAIMAMYMSEMNRRDNAYIYLSHAISICCMFGGLQGSSSDLDERDIRVIWTLFCLTRDLSCMMGRPPLYPIEAFKLPYPTAAPGLPPPTGLIAHIELSKIADYIVSNTYAIAPRENVASFRVMEEQVKAPLQMLDDWLENLPEHLRVPFQSPSEEVYQAEGLPHDRALFMLHMKWNQLLILTLRPLFFLAVKSAIGADFLHDCEQRDILEHGKIMLIFRCSAAARRNLWLGRHINELCNVVTSPSGATSPGKLVMLDLHHIFNATIVLLLHQMVFFNVVNTDTFGITVARQIFELEARTERLGGGVTGYASDCVGVLIDLAALVAHIRPLRFKGSEHVNTGVDVGWCSPLGDGLVDGSCPKNTLESPAMVTNEQLTANLSLENPYGPDGMYSGQHPLGSPSVTGVPEFHTNQKEFQRWVDEGGLIQGWSLSGPLGGYTGL